MGLTAPTETIAHAASRRSGTFNRIVVPLGPDDGLALRAAEVAARISAETATIVFVCVLEVPRELPLDALFPEEETETRARLRRAAAVVERYGVRAVQRLEREHTAATKILELAADYDADLIVVAAPVGSRRGHTVLGHTATSILHRAACRVMLVRPAQPAGTPLPAR